MDRTIKIAAVLFIAVIIGCAAFFFMAHSVESSPVTVGSSGTSGNVTVYYFYGEECPHCHSIMPFLENLSSKYPQVTFTWYETWHNQTNVAAFATINKQLGIKGVAVPEVVTGTTALIGEKNIPAKLEAAIVDQLKKRTD